MGRALGFLVLISLGCSGTGVRAAGPAEPSSATAANWTGDRPMAVAAVPGAKKRGGGGPLFQVRWLQEGAADRTVRSPGEAAIH